MYANLASLQELHVLLAALASRGGLMQLEATVKQLVLRPQAPHAIPMVRVKSLVLTHVIHRLYVSDASLVWPGWQGRVMSKLCR